ncbi:hypothetical protein [Qipengyuania flava]|uniref:hypothetical protein n=1 Tax=Qipengyuania flava TaxID=192812 RepID=UPI001C62EEE1|nr:hypothetical protein [Qipengyuania flava]QYJ06255.1 hypothetical protein KUV82_09185 [Qipengyuania flava]
MKKLICAAVAAALVIPGAAMASHPQGNGPGGQVNQNNPDGFKNRGQCQSALSAEINRQRKNPEERVPFRQDQKASDFQRDMLDRFECRSEDDGPYRVYLR